MGDRYVSPAKSICITATLIVVVFGSIAMGLYVVGDCINMSPHSMKNLEGDGCMFPSTATKSYKRVCPDNYTLATNKYCYLNDRLEFCGFNGREAHRCIDNEFYVMVTCLTVTLVFATGGISLIYWLVEKSPPIHRGGGYFTDTDNDGDDDGRMLRRRGRV